MIYNSVFTPTKTTKNRKTKKQATRSSTVPKIMPYRRGEPLQVKQPSGKIKTVGLG